MIMSTRVNNTKLLFQREHPIFTHLSRIPSMDLIRNIPLVWLSIKKTRIWLQRSRKRLNRQKKTESQNGEQNPRKSEITTRDGDLDRPEDEAYAESYFINANSKQAPQVVDRNVQPILNQSELYSGCYINASVTFYAYNSNGNKGIAAGLGKYSESSWWRASWFQSECKGWIRCSRRWGWFSGLRINGAVSSPT